MTPFCFEHDFLAPSPDAVFSAYFDPAHQVEQDRALDVIEREVIELADHGEELHRLTRVVPRRQLPSLLKPLSSGPMHYLERATWRKRAREIVIEMRPSFARARITATYRLEQTSPKTIRRRYAGEVSVDVALFASRIERGIVAEFERSMPVAAACTQKWLDRQSIVARA